MLILAFAMATIVVGIVYFYWIRLLMRRGISPVTVMVVSVSASLSARYNYWAAVAFWIACTACVLIDHRIKRDLGPDATEKRGGQQGNAWAPRPPRATVIPPAPPRPQ